MHASASPTERVRAVPYPGRGRPPPHWSQTRRSLVPGRQRIAPSCPSPDVRRVGAQDAWIIPSGRLQSPPEQGTAAQPRLSGALSQSTEQEAAASTPRTVFRRRAPCASTRASEEQRGPPRAWAATRGIQAGPTARMN